MPLLMDPNAARPLRGAPIAVLDFETTGPDPTSCLPVQVAVCHAALGDSAPEVVYKSYIDPGVPIPAESTAVHHITDAHVQGAPRWPDAVRALVPHLEGRVLVAFNLPFDWQVLLRGWVEAGGDAAELPFGALDPLVWAKLVHRYQKGKRLVDVAGRYGIEVDAHDAAGDVLATALLMPKLLHDLGRHRECGKAPLMSVGAMWAWTRARGIEEDRSYAAWCRTQNKPEPASVWERLAGSDSPGK